MNLTGTETLINLGRAFAGESQAKNRYLFYAEKAKQDGYAYIEKICRYIAQNETAHAKVFFDHIVNGMPNDVNNLNIDAGYPFELKDTINNMLYAKAGETSEYETIYPNFGKIAADEGFPAIAASFNMIAAIEGEHAKIFGTLHDKLANGSLYKGDAPVVWKCDYCGYETTSKDAFMVCPVCKKPQGFVIPQIEFLH
ncbi:rubrerythrin family protein [Feifania hominis]|uniref:Rubrerythrin family protein n=1 Tax=Feifania hominis TaxID=2763660 RepID=A0A926HU97_9FIRM|nr:ferritin family protein [Feifania hominis]MBC8535715.1 rubrerythrin family protein [Feifania hominis]